MLFTTEQVITLIQSLKEEVLEEVDVFQEDTVSSKKTIEKIFNDTLHSLEHPHSYQTLFDFPSEFELGEEVSMEECLHPDDPLLYRTFGYENADEFSQHWDIYNPIPVRIVDKRPDPFRWSMPETIYLVECDGNLYFTCDSFLERKI